MNGERLAWWDYALALAPLMLALIGGALGIAVGGAGAATNLALAGRFGGRARVAASLAGTGIALLFWVGLVAALR